MKTKLFLLILLFVIQFGCKEKKEVEIINLDDDSYMNFYQFDKPPELSRREDQQDIFLKIENRIKEEGLKITSNDHYRLLIYMNEKGKIDKAVILDGSEEKIAKIIIDELSKRIDKPVLKDGKPVKFKFWFPFEIGLRDVTLPNNQTDSITFDNETYFVAVEEMPEPVGGLKFIQEKIRYPEIAKRAGIEGKVYVLAFIDENGEVTSAKIIKGIGAGCDEAALDAVKQTKFIPGKQKGKPVKVQVSIPIVFKLESKITIEDILEKLKWNINQAEVIRTVSDYLKLTEYKSLIQKNSRSRVIQFTGGSLYGIKTDSWSFAFENDSLDIISIQFRSTSSSDKSKTYSELKSEIEKISLTKIESQPNEWILSFDNKSLARLQIYPGGRTTDIQILLSSNKFINEYSIK